MYNFFNYDGSKFKLRIFHERYFVNEEKRTVTVKADVSMYVPEFILRTIAPERLPVGFSEESMYPFGLYGHDPVQMTATARCCPEDEFDVETGKKIAMARLEAIAYERFANTLSRWNERFQRFSRLVNRMSGDFTEKAFMAAGHDRRYIDRISEGQE